MSRLTNEEVEVLWVKAVDGLLAEDEQQRWEAHLALHPELRAEWEEDMQIKSITDAMADRIAADADIEPIRLGPSARVVLGTGFWLLFVGLAAVATYGFVALMRHPDLPWIVQGGILAATAGFAVLLGYAVRIRLRSAGRDPYEEVDQ